MSTEHSLTRTALRLAAGACVAAFLLCLVGGMAHPIVDGQAHSVDSLLAPGSPWAQYLILGGTVALLLGLPVVVTALAPRLGRLGMIGGALYLVGNATCAMAHLIVEAMVAVPLAADPAGAAFVADNGSLLETPVYQLSQVIGGPVLLLGQLLLGIAVIRSGLPRWIGGLLVVGAVLAFVPLPEIAVLAGVLFELPRGLAVAALGVIVIRSVSTRQPEQDQSDGVRRGEQVAVD